MLIFDERWGLMHFVWTALGLAEDQRVTLDGLSIVTLETWIVLP